MTRRRSPLSLKSLLVQWTFVEGCSSMVGHRLVFKNGRRSTGGASKSGRYNNLLTLLVLLLLLLPCVCLCSKSYLCFGILLKKPRQEERRRNDVKKREEKKINISYTQIKKIMAKFSKTLTDQVSLLCIKY